MGASRNRRVFAFCLVAAMAACGSGITSVQASGLTLDEAVTTAMKLSPEAVTRENNFTRAKLNYDNSKSSLKPGVAGYGSATANGSNADVAKKDLSGSLTTAIPFGHLLGTSGLFGNNAAKQFAEVQMAWSEAQADYMANGTTLANSVRGKFFRLLKARANVKFAKDSADRLEKVTLPDVQARRAKGGASESDVIRAEAALASARVQARKAAREAVDAEADLGRVLGMDKVPELATVAVDEALVQKMLAVDPGQALNAVSARRPDVLRSTDNQRKAEMSLSLAKSDLLPDIGLFASATAPTRKDGPRLSIKPNINSGNQPNTIILTVDQADQTQDTLDWSAGVSVSYPIFDWGINKRDIKLREMEKVQADKAIADTRTMVQKDIVSAQAVLQDAYEMWRISALNLKAEELSYATAKAKYGVGLLSKVGFDEAGSQLNEAKAKVEQAGFDTVMACYSFKAALGE